MEKAIELIKEFESLRTRAYRCPAGVWTIGWGHTAGVKRGDSITEAEAERLLRADVADLGRQLRQTGVALSPNREAALLSFAYNVGFDALLRSTLWRKVRTNPADPTIGEEFGRWKYAGGRVMAGLVRRRAKEAALYFAE
ncbi:MAG: lysozyme [Muribaculaceae bacterium]|nr:lysozyme [Muribaculaceae bacterium]